jgi:hypothetical protein
MVRQYATRRPASHGCGRLPPSAHPHPHAGARGDGRLALERAAGIRLRDAPAVLLCRVLRRPEAAALTMGYNRGGSCAQ